MKIIFSFLLLVFCAAFLYSCSSPNNPVAEQSLVEQLFTMKTGDTWTFRIKRYDTTNVVISDITDTWLIANTIDTFGHTLYFYAQSNTGPRVLYYKNSRLYNYPDSVSPIVQYPMSLGQPLIRRDTAYSYPPDTTILKDYLYFEGAGNIVDMGFEKFNCAKFRAVSLYGPKGQVDSSGMIVFYMALGKGLVKEEDYSYSNRVRYLYRTYELQSYKVN